MELKAIKVKYKVFNPRDLRNVKSFCQPLNVQILLVGLCEGTVKTYCKIEIDSSKDARLSQFENTFLSMATHTTSTVPFKEATQGSREQLRTTVCASVCV